MLVQAAFLSAPQYVVHGPTTLKDLRRATVCVAATEDGAKGWVQSIVQVSSNASLCYCKATDWQDLQACSSDPIFECEFSISAQLEQCHKLLDDGTAAAGPDRNIEMLFSDKGRGYYVGVLQTAPRQYPGASSQALKHYFQGLSIMAQ